MASALDTLTAFSSLLAVTAACTLSFKIITVRYDKILALKNLEDRVRFCAEISALKRSSADAVAFLRQDFPQHQRALHDSNFSVQSHLQRHEDRFCNELKEKCLHISPGAHKPLNSSFRGNWPRWMGRFHSNTCLSRQQNFYEEKT